MTDKTYIPGLDTDENGQQWSPVMVGPVSVSTNHTSYHLTGHFSLLSEHTARLLDNSFILLQYSHENNSTPLNYLKYNNTRMDYVYHYEIAYLDNRLIPAIGQLFYLSGCTDNTPGSSQRSPFYAILYSSSASQRQEFQHDTLRRR